MGVEKLKTKTTSSTTKLANNTMSASELLTQRLDVHHQIMMQHHHYKEEEDKLHDSNTKALWAKLMEKVVEFCAQADMFATAHVWPIHILCILVATVIIPISAVAVVWDLMAAIVFEIPDLSTINTPAFVLFINFIAIPLAMYGYMMEYLLHEHSKLAIIALICVIVNPILFSLRALVEYLFDGYRGEEKIYFELFKRHGQEHPYPIGLLRYRQGDPYSDSEEGDWLIKQTFGNV